MSKLKSLIAITALALAVLCPGGPAAAYTPNDTYNSYQWNFGQMGMGDAWDLDLGGSREITVAVIDTGVAYDLSDLSGTKFNLEDAWDFVDGDSDPYDQNGHGTHITGTIAQTTDNNLGVAGMAFNSTILPIRVLDSSGSGTAADVASGIYLAVDAGADVINLSLGSSSGSSGIQTAIDYAYRAGVLVVAASGNDGGASLDYPAAYGQVLAVGATDAGYNLASYSNHTSNMVVASGGDLDYDLNGDGYGDGILQQYIDGNYWFLDGTSMATAHVSATAALVLAEAVDQGWSLPSGPGLVDWLKNVITSTTLDLGAEGQDSTYGYGLVRTENTLRLLNATASSSDELPYSDYESLSASYTEVELTTNGTESSIIYQTGENSRQMLAVTREYEAGEKILH